jgi:quercetin dioxygenase-like cupin family protein
MSIKKCTGFTLTAAMLMLLIAGWNSKAACEPADKNRDSSTVATTRKWLLVVPEKIDWQPTGLLPPGAQMAVLDGDPSKPAFFTMRLKMPDGYRIPAHWHSQPERVTVLSGTLYLGTGDGAKDTAVPLGPGTYSSMPPKMAHYGWMKGETILQLTSIGPWTVNYIDPADDPRIKTK